MEITRQLKPKGIVVIPKDIRESIRLKDADMITFSVKGDEIIIRKKQDPQEWLKSFLKYRKKGKGLTLQDMKGYEEESYDLP